MTHCISRYKHQWCRLLLSFKHVINCEAFGIARSVRINDLSECLDAPEDYLKPACVLSSAASEPFIMHESRKMSPLRSRSAWCSGDEPRTRFSIQSENYSLASQGSREVKKNTELDGWPRNVVLDVLRFQTRAFSILKKNHGGLQEKYTSININRWVRNKVIDSRLSLATHFDRDSTGIIFCMKNANNTTFSTKHLSIFPSQITCEKLLLPLQMEFRS